MLAWLICGATTPTEPIDPKNPPHGRFSDDWLEVYLAGGKVGFGHTTMTRKEDRIHTATMMRIRVGRVDQPVEIEIAQNTTETVGGEPLTFGSKMNAATMQTSSKGTISKGRVSITNSQYGMDQTQEFDFPKGALMAWGLYREGLLRGDKPGTVYKLDVYAPDLRLDGAVTATTTIGEWEDFEHDGKTMRGQKTNLVMESPIGSMEVVSWVDKNGTPVKSKVPVPGLGDMVLIVTDQKSAVADFMPPEIFMRSTIKVDTKIDRKKVRQIKYLIRGSAGDAELASMPDTDMQKVTARDDGSIELVATRIERTKAGSSAKAIGGGDLADCLDSNLMINTEDPKLVKLAKRAAGGETEPYALADKLRRFVSEYIDNKNLNIGFATASEVCRTKEGDCSEHGVLLAALGRINGLPSRVVAGVAYVPLFGAQQDIFGYHMWTQFYIDGKWVDVDAALNETDCSPARIAFAVSSLKNAGLADLSLPLISKIGAIDIDILEIDGKTVSAD